MLSCGIDQVVCVEHTYRVIAVLAHEHIDDLPQGVALGADRLRALHDKRAGAVGRARRVVGAVIWDDDDVIEFAGIILREQGLHEVADDGLLVARRHQHGEPAAGRLARPLYCRAQRIGQVKRKIDQIEHGNRAR